MKLLSFDNELSTQINSIPLRIKECITGYVTSSKRKSEPVPAPVNKKVPVEKQQQSEIRILKAQYSNSLLSGMKNARDTPDDNQIEITGSVSRAFVTRGGSISFIVSTVRDGHYLEFIKAMASPKLEVDFIRLMSAGHKDTY